MDEFFYNSLGIRALIIYFCFVLINLINDYKNVYYCNNNVCLGVCMTVIMGIVSIKRVMRWFFMCIVIFKIIVSMKRYYVYVWRMG